MSLITEDKSCKTFITLHLPLYFPLSCLLLHSASDCSFVCFLFSLFFILARKCDWRGQKMVSVCIWDNFTFSFMIHDHHHHHRVLNVSCSVLLLFVRFCHFQFECFIHLVCVRRVRCALCAGSCFGQMIFLLIRCSTWWHIHSVTTNQHYYSLVIGHWPHCTTIVYAILG